MIETRLPTWTLGAVASVDINPVAVFETGAVALDALIETARSGSG